MRKIKLEPLKDFATGICKVIGVGALVLAYSELARDTSANYYSRDEHMNRSMEYRRYGRITYGYSDAIDAIAKSNMWSENKKEAISYVNRNDDSEYYGAVISIVKSNMWSENKLKAIKDLCNE